MNTPTQRDRLEARARYLNYILSSGEQVGRLGIVAELKNVATQLMELQAGDHFTQAQGDTLAKIVCRDIGNHSKVAAFLPPESETK